MYENIGLSSVSLKKKMEFFVTRLHVAYDLSLALKYLHDNKWVTKQKMGLPLSMPHSLSFFLFWFGFDSVIYRDLKPDNIGFDVRGDVKLFDFGLAKEIDRSQVQRDGLYKLTGDTGSPRYMAPEGEYRDLFVLDISFVFEHL